MYAVHHTVTFTDRAAADADLPQIVPQVSGLPGFAAGYWLARSADHGLGLVMFDSEEAAQSFADFLKTAEAPGVKLDQESLWVGEVLAHA